MLDDTHSPGAQVPSRFLINPVYRYLCSGILAWMFYVAWLFESSVRANSLGQPIDLGFRLGFSLFISVFGGFTPAIALMIAPWRSAVRAHRWIQIPGLIYFPVIGAVGIFVLGCAAASLAPKPLFIEDQTFLEGATIAAERQGICMLCAGLLFGLTYWRLSARRG